ncbi:MAG: hypothetical protein ABIO83_08175 [Ilumatobacteraceae bacterium]
MGIRDRFYTATTAKAIMSWRILAGIGVGVVAGITGLPIVAAVLLGVAAYTASVAIAMPRRHAPPAIDPFGVGEPWRQIIQQAQGSGRKLSATVDATPEGPLRQTLRDIADQVQHGLAEAWQVARRGHEIDDTLRRLDPTSLRSKLTTLQQRNTDGGSPDTQAAIESVERQLATADRLRQQSADTAASLRLTQTQLDELVARASEVRIGAFDTVTYRAEVDDLVVRLEALHQAVRETAQQ